MGNLVCTNKDCQKYGKTFITYADNRCSWCGERATTETAWKEGTCLHGRVKDWSGHYGGKKNWYCPDCGRRWYGGKEYSKKEWEVYVNEPENEGIKNGPFDRII